MNRILEIGFRCVGHWELEGERINFVLLTKMMEKNVLYAFVINGEVRYIGKTANSLPKRLSGYKNPGISQSTNIKNNNNIRMALSNSETVDIFALPDPGYLSYGIFKVNLAAALEDEIISKLNPPWNGAIKEIAANNQDIEDTQESPELASSAALKEIEIEYCDIALGPTYYNNGFFNIPIAKSILLGDDGDSISIVFPDGESIIGYINRKCNLNATPRIFGGKNLKNWFASNAKLGQTIKISIIDKSEVRLSILT